MVHVIGNPAFACDTLFMPDGESARADFLGGDAGELYDSIQRVLLLPDELHLFICHDYGPGDREVAWETTVGEQKAKKHTCWCWKVARRLYRLTDRTGCSVSYAQAYYPIFAGQYAGW